MIKQRSRSADALDLLKDETIFEERTAGVESAHALDAVIGHESSATGNNRNNQPTPAAAVSVSGIVVEAGVPKTSSDSTALDVSAIAERHQQEQLDEAWDALAVLLQKNMIQQKHVTVFQTLYRENIQGKEKVTKLKNLLARSAKVQKDVSMIMPLNLEDMFSRVLFAFRSFHGWILYTTSHGLHNPNMISYSKKMNYLRQKDH
jgi:hypothetical protein